MYIFNKVNVKYLNNIYFHNPIFLITACLITAYNGEKTPILTCHGDRLICCNKFRTPRHYTIVKLVSVGPHPTPWSGVAIRVPAKVVVS